LTSILGKAGDVVSGIHWELAISTETLKVISRGYRGGFGTVHRLCIQYVAFLFIYLPREELILPLNSAATPFWDLFE